LEGKGHLHPSGESWILCLGYRRYRSDGEDDGDQACGNLQLH